MSKPLVIRARSVSIKRKKKAKFSKVTIDGYDMYDILSSFRPEQILDFLCTDDVLDYIEDNPEAFSSLTGK